MFTSIKDRRTGPGSSRTTSGTPTRQPAASNSRSLPAIELAPTETLAADIGSNVVWKHGIRLINAGFFWEAHEVLEPVWWRAAPYSRERFLVQAVIHLANAVMHDTEGHLWVQDYRRPSESGPEWWTIFDREGRALGRFETPEGFVVFQIGSDFILGRSTDELDVEYVEVGNLRGTPESVF